MFQNLHKHIFLSFKFKYHNFILNRIEIPESIRSKTSIFFNNDSTRSIFFFYLNSKSCRNIYGFHLFYIVIKGMFQDKMTKNLFKYFFAVKISGHPLYSSYSLILLHNYDSFNKYTNLR